MKKDIALAGPSSFVIDKADLELGTVTATKLDGYALRMSVSVRPRGTKQLIVRANGQYQEEAVTDPAPYPIHPEVVLVSPGPSCS